MNVCSCAFENVFVIVKRMCVQLCVCMFECMCVCVCALACKYAYISVHGGIKMIIFLSHLSVCVYAST